MVIVSKEIDPEMEIVEKELNTCLLFHAISKLAAGIAKFFYDFCKLLQTN